ncbi:hypothetical protein [Rickettsiales endosymbiont of Stachyamoeba lipophora]|uniref:hypothetical protein n=1 Tax=Rickettsiales endosymbiont of Stachyamoeba lipophora TaxID=2486578 RepID=UPI000F646D9C|nr:hypothetical protein [Rickettsiales endosymbiont of Stachyamoeba lipophora]AZL15598.1 hypothetical protein EF513_03415 [Rickettsiales endosymbiont of Stachyamoeba lipophora]
MPSIAISDQTVQPQSISEKVSSHAAILAQLISHVNLVPDAKRKQEVHELIIELSRALPPHWAGDSLQTDRVPDEETEQKIQQLHKLLGFKGEAPKGNKAFLYPYSKHDSAGAVQAIYWSIEQQDFVAITGENVRRKGDVDYTSAGFRNPIGPNISGNKIEADIQGAFFANSSKEGAFDLKDFLIAGEKALTDLGYYDIKFMWTVENIIKYRQLVIQNLKAHLDNKYNDENLAWLNEIDLNYLENSLRELREETGFKPEKMAGIKAFELRTIGTMGSLGKFLAARRVAIQEVSTLGLYLGEMSDQEIINLILPNDDCGAIRLIPLSEVTISPALDPKTQETLDFVTAPEHTIIYKNGTYEHKKEELKLRCTHNYVPFHWKQFLKELINDFTSHFTEKGGRRKDAMPYKDLEQLIDKFYKLEERLKKNKQKELSQLSLEDIEKLTQLKILGEFLSSTQHNSVSMLALKAGIVKKAVDQYHAMGARKLSDFIRGMSTEAIKALIPQQVSPFSSIANLTTKLKITYQEMKDRINPSNIQTEEIQKLTKLKALTDFVNTNIQNQQNSQSVIDTLENFIVHYMSKGTTNIGDFVSKLNSQELESLIQNSAQGTHAAAESQRRKSFSQPPF